jgi:cell division septation protein DedD
VKKVKAIRHKKYVKAIHKKKMAMKVKKPKVASQPASTKKEAVMPEPKPVKEPVLKSKPDSGSFATEAPQPAIVPPAPVTVAPAAPQPSAPAAPKVAAPVPAAEPIAPMASAKPQFTVLTGIYAAEKEAKEHERELSQKGYHTYTVKIVGTKTTWYHVMAGEYANKEEAEKAAAGIAQKEGLRAKVQPYKSE